MKKRQVIYGLSISSQSNHMIQVGRFYSVRKEGKERKKRAKFLHDTHFALKFGENIFKVFCSSQ